MEQESEYLAALESAATFTVEGSQLEMRDSSGAIAVQMTRNLGVSIPEPAPGTPVGRVTARQGVNIRSGPGSNYPVIGLAPYRGRGRDRRSQRRQPMVGGKHSSGSAGHRLGIG